jgi:hypothetical protein
MSKAKKHLSLRLFKNVLKGNAYTEREWNFSLEKNMFIHDSTTISKTSGIPRPRLGVPFFRI